MQYAGERNISVCMHVCMYEVSRIGHGQLLRGQLFAGYASLMPPEAGIDHENDVSLFTGDAQVGSGVVGLSFIGGEASSTADLP